MWQVQSILVETEGGRNHRSGEKFSVRAKEDKGVGMIQLGGQGDTR